VRYRRWFRRHVAGRRGKVVGGGESGGGRPSSSRCRDDDKLFPYNVSGGGGGGGGGNYDVIGVITVDQVVGMHVNATMAGTGGGERRPCAQIVALRGGQIDFELNLRVRFPHRYNLLIKVCYFVALSLCFWEHFFSI
jgi:hypothetical protein